MRSKVCRLARNSVRRRLFSSERPSPAPPAPVKDSLSPQTAKQQSRIDRILARSPKFLHKHITALRRAPISHFTAFLVLHELTAVIPLFGLAGAFHYYNWLPPFFAEGAWVVAGVEKFGRYFRKKGWISDMDEEEVEREVKAGDAQKVEDRGTGGRATIGKWFNRSEISVRWVVEFATAYAVVKAFLIPRLMLSAWGAPWFARWTVIPLINLFRRSRPGTAGV